MTWDVNSPARVGTLTPVGQMKKLRICPSEDNLGWHEVYRV
jgi:hypothetical protein